MAWPTPTDYAEAVQKPSVFLEDEELRGGQVARTPLGLPMLWSGNFADVYKMHCPATGNTWALKCFTRPVQGLHERYRIIAAHLERARLPFTVDFQYLEHGIRIRDEWFPAIKMRWVEGLTLNQFVEEHLERPQNLQMLLDLWVKLTARLREAGIAHADLQHGNVILVPQNGGALALRLVDYDGMYVPALAGTRSGERGLPAFQHPQRIREGTYNAEIDRFSHLVIYTAIRSLTVGRIELWQRFNTGENLLFRASDFEQPGASELFHSLWRTEDPDTKALVGRLMLACQRPLEESALLQHIVAADGHVIHLTDDEYVAVETILGSVARPAAPSVPPILNAALAPAWLAESIEQQTPQNQGAATPLPLPPSPAAPSEASSLPAWLDHRRGQRPNVAPMATGGRRRVRSNQLSARITSMLGRGALAAISPFRWIDRLLASLVGPENRLLHGFARGMLGVTVIGILVFLLRELTIPATGRLLRSGTDGLPSGSASIAGSATVQLHEEHAITRGAGPPLAIAPFSEKKATQYQREWAQHLGVPVELTNSIGMKLTFIPPGKFMMGSSSEEIAWATGECKKHKEPKYCFDNVLNEAPQHRVQISRSFYLGVYPVTQAEYQKVIGINPSQYSANGRSAPEVARLDTSRHPVETVSWDDAVQFCQRLSALPKERSTHRVYRLPMEAEWEYACRAGGTGRWTFGDDVTKLADYAWYGGIETHGLTHPVGQKKANAWGLCDVHGNVWEWCMDWHSADYYKQSPFIDPIGPPSGSDHVIRGGSFYDRAHTCQSAYRHSNWRRLPFVGFRVVIGL